MKISVWGLTNNRGLPLATVLRIYGRHSVVGYDPEPAPPGGHPDEELRRMEMVAPRVPVAHTPRLCYQEGHDLAIIAADLPSRAWAMLNLIDTCAGVTPPPIVIITPFAKAPHNWLIPQGLTVGYAPFDYHPAKVTGRLMTLSRVVVTRLCGTPGLLRQTVSDAWKWVDNRIPIVEQEKA